VSNNNSEAKAITYLLTVVSWFHMGPPACPKQFKKLILDSMRDMLNKSHGKIMKNIELQKPFDIMEANLHYNNNVYLINRPY